MSISRFNTSVVSGTNENTLALVNLNVDLSLLKLEAPSEFKDLGRSLTRQRREIAEDGSVHRTARRLGAVFEGIAPHTPSLIRAYGSRVSEISRDSSNEGLLSSRGVFADCAGMDGTSVWAAATSGKTAIAVHLLACMLARAWSSSQATSIWVEIIEARRQDLRKQISDGLYNDSTQLGLALSADLSRNDLAEWDASTRAWLQVADDVQISRQKQLMLIINNVNIPVNQGSAAFGTYARVIEAWKTATETIEKVIRGQPHNVAKGSVLLGLAAWHLYPNILVLGQTPTTVNFNDPVVEESGQLTIGLSNPDANKDEGVYWSLSLSHLRFYGDPVRVTSITTRDASRLNIDEFHLLVLGGIIADWGGLYALDLLKAAEFFVCLDNITFRSNETSSLQPWKWHWIHLLGTASRKLLTSEGTERDLAVNTIALGQRRGRSLLRESASSIPPLFGLCDSWVLHILKMHDDLNYTFDQDETTGIEMMRYIAQKLHLQHAECIIRVRGASKYVTAIPHRDKDREYHINWVETEPSSSWDGICTCHEMGHHCHAGRCPCILHGQWCSYVCHPEGMSLQNTPCPGCQRSDLRIETTQERYDCKNLKDHESFRYIKGSLFDTLTLPLTLSDLGIKSKPGKDKPYAGVAPLFAIQTRSNAVRDGRRYLCNCFYEPASVKSPTFVLIAGSASDVGLFLRADLGLRARKRRLHEAQKRAQTERNHTIDQVISSMKTGQISPKHVVRYLTALQEGDPIHTPTFRKGLEIRHFADRFLFDSLHALSLATKTFTDLPGATIDLKIISTHLHRSLWLPSQGVRYLSRQQKFACIAMFESGLYNIDPAVMQDVIAISSRNSIFASAILHNDPGSLDHVDDVRRVVGNVGKTGMVLMVAPQAPRTKGVDLNEFRLVCHNPFDGKPEDSFKSTSLHLTFTEFELPVDIGERGAIDKDLCFVETLIQVYDRNQWIADIDVLPVFHNGNDAVRRNTVSCTGCSSTIPSELVSIDNWEELLEIPNDLGKLRVAVFRAYDNWLARLAAACICQQKGLRIVINPSKDVCWHCCCTKRWNWTPETLRKSNMVLRDSIQMDVTVDEQVGEAEIAMDSLSSSDSESSSDDDNSASQPSPNTSSESVFVDSGLRSVARSLLSVRINQEPSRAYEYDGYESDETVIRDSDSDDENDALNTYIPQVFIC
ncbi:hypothetical protein yc1106_05229 [Curvularia clavata]|uniref:Uncharacterized protein n=1 Tax=Curvularia clavata TaxID=95742 RepID=A0A9Q8Z952_CURCL|nr:hypothetical protein yc1106_05229 [Curvularia clavata]